jgi:hypothetical protein
MGLLQPGYCNSPSETYHVAEYYVSDTDSRPKPLFYQNHNLYLICFNEGFYQKCLDTIRRLDAGSSIEQFSSLFSQSYRNYFPVATVALVIVFISLLITVVHERGDTFFLRYEDTTIAGFRIEKRLIIRINHFLCLSLVIILIVSSNYQMFLREETCSDIYKGNHGDPDYCTMITSCGMKVGSIIEPRDFIVQNFKTLNVMFAIFLSITILFRCMSTPNDRRVGIDYSNDDLNEMVRLRSLNRSPAPRHPNWKEVTETSTLTNFNELDCPICLSNLQNKPILLQSSNQNIVNEFDEESNINPPENPIATDDPESFTNLNPDNQNDPVTLEVKIVESQCHHIFHETCIQEWFRNHDTCPVCRSSLHQPRNE